MDIRQTAIMLTIAALFAVFSFATVEAVYPSPEYSEYCQNPSPIHPSGDQCNTTFNKSLVQQCHERGGTVQYGYNDSGCRINATCSMCQSRYENAQNKRDTTGFIITTVLGIIAIVTVLQLQTIPEVTYGFVIGGLLTVFVATGRHYEILHRWLRPLVLLGELTLVLYLTYNVFHE